MLRSRKTTGLLQKLKTGRERKSVKILCPQGQGFPSYTPRAADSHGFTSSQSPTRQFLMVFVVQKKIRVKKVRNSNFRVQEKKKKFHPPKLTICS